MRRKSPRMTRGVLFAVALLTSPVAIHGATAPTPPRLTTESFEGLRQPLPFPYAERADTDKQVAAARQRANREGKLLLLDLGANWCSSCRSLAGTLELPQMRRFVNDHFVVVVINVGRFDRNMHIPARYDVDQLPGLPALLIIDPRRDELINEGELSIFTHLPHPTPQAVGDWLAKWTKSRR